MQTCELKCMFMYKHVCAYSLFAKVMEKHAYVSKVRISIIRLAVLLSLHCQIRIPGKWCHLQRQALAVEPRSGLPGVGQPLRWPDVE